MVGTKELKIAKIGFGGIGASHKAAYDLISQSGTPVRLVAICDKNGEMLSNDMF